MSEAVPYRRFALLDRDGVINRERGDFTVTVDEWEWAPGALEGLRMLAEAGVGVIVVTNQSCIARGRQTEEGLERLHAFMLEEVRRAGGGILRVYHCPHRTEDGCTCRKPEPGMILAAARDYGFTPADTFFAGDSRRDLEAGRRAGVRTILVTGGGGIDPAPDGMADAVVPTLREAAGIIIAETPPQS